MRLDDLTQSLGRGRALNRDEAEEAARELAGEAAPDEGKAAFLSALAAKGETPAEIASLARAFRAMALDPGLGRWATRAVDIVGTGGDHAGGYNISTLATLVVAAAGAPVIKHGNRGVTSKCGSADLFAAIGFDLEAPPERIGRAMERLGYAFLFAPAWHPAFRRIGPVRRMLAARGQRTVFNILGPLLNPARPAHVLLGAATPSLSAAMAAALEALDTPAAVCVHGVIAEGRGIDELTSATTNLVRGVGRLRSLDGEWTPESLGLARAPFTDLLGGDGPANLAMANALAAGGGPKGLADTIALNAATALWISGARPDVRSAIGEARDLLLGGAVRRKMDDTRDFFASP
jgi:anthranilate phosphoribosyltransferase